MCWIEVPLNLIGVSILHAHHSVNPEELDVCLVLIIEVLSATLGKSYRSRLFHTVSFSVWQNLICEILMHFIDLVWPIARVHRCAYSECEIKTVVLWTEWSFEIEVSHLYLLTYCRILTINQIYDLECCDCGDYYDNYEGYQGPWKCCKCISSLVSQIDLLPKHVHGMKVLATLFADLFAKRLPLFFMPLPFILRKYLIHFNKFNLFLDSLIYIHSETINILETSSI